MLASIGCGGIFWVFLIGLKQWRGEGKMTQGQKNVKGWRHGRESDLERRVNKETHMEGAALTRQSTGWSLAGTRSVNYSSCSGEEGQNSSPAPFSPYFHISLWGWERWAICYKCMMNFIKYSQLLLKSLEICKIEPNMPRTDLTRRAEMWNLPEIKSSAGIQGLYESLSFFFSLSRTWFYWNNDSYMFY